MPVGTQGTIKGVLPDHVAATGSQIILANTYHLMLRPGEKVVADLGDLHRFMGWPGPILTDSGGFQVFSLSDINQINDDGVTFKSHVDGSMVHLTPERSIRGAERSGGGHHHGVRRVPAGARRRRSTSARRSSGRCAGRSSAWPPISGRTINRCSASCRAGRTWRCASSVPSELIEMNFPGYAIGGLAVGEGFEAMKAVLAATTPMLPADKPRYLMGVGFPRDIVAAVAGGDRHVRLRDAHAQRPQCLCLYRDGADSAAKQPISRAIRGRSRTAATATPAALSRAGRSGTFFSPARCLARCWFPCIIFGSTSG